MDTRSFVQIALVAANLAAAWAQGQAPSDELLGDRILRMSDAYQVAFVNSDLDRGMPMKMSGPLGMLVLNRSPLVLPILEKKIEAVLRSPSPLDCFTDKSVDPQYVVDLAAATITYAGDGQALKEIGKLLRIDSKRFDSLVTRTLLAAISRGRPFTVAYEGFEIGDPELAKRIVAWADRMLVDDVNSGTHGMKDRWAEAMAEKYGGAPTEVNWANDPIAMQISPTLAASLHDEILRLGAEAFEKRVKK